VGGDIIVEDPIMKKFIILVGAGEQPRRMVIPIACAALRFITRSNRVGVRPPSRQPWRRMRPWQVGRILNESI